MKRGLAVAVVLVCSLAGAALALASASAARADDGTTGTTPASATAPADENAPPSAPTPIAPRLIVAGVTAIGTKLSATYYGPVAGNLT